MPSVSALTLRRGLLVCAVLALSACAGGRDLPTQINDPHEEHNRAIHQANLKLDEIVLQPTSKAYGTIVPEPVQRGVANMANNLNLPGDVANNLLQVRVGQATHNTVRFLVNSTVGVLGIFDVATAMGIEEKPTDFGETLYYWGFPEGSYVEMPVAGPATTRHSIGRFVDLALNPVGAILPAPESHIATGVSIADAFGARYRNTELIESILYDSADSYAQARLLYLQNRRFKLRSGSGQEADYLDPYEDPYEDPYGEIE